MCLSTPNISLDCCATQRLAQVNQWLDANPGERIPEPRLLSDKDWLEGLRGTNLEKDEDFRLTLSTLRNNGAFRFQSDLWKALKAFKKATASAFPTEISQLKPYIQRPIDDAVLERWAVVPAAELLPELQPGGELAITQKAPVNEALDIRIAVGITNFSSAGMELSNRWARVQ